jgi:tight adherence protein C
MRVQDFTIGDLLPAGVSLDEAITVLSGLAMLATVLAMWQVLRPNSAFERRLEQIGQRKEDLRQGALAAARRGRQRTTAVGVMRETVTRLNLLRSKHATEARNMLAQAGIRSRDAMVGYLFARITLPFVFGIALLALPDGLDLMVICAEAGLSLDATLVRVSRELGNGSPELAEELSMTAAELTFLPERRLAFDNLNTRTNSDGIRAVVNTLQQTAKFGTPLAQSLRILAAEMRQARMTRAEEKAARLPALLTVPMILFILPCLFIVLLGPAALGIIDTFSHR